MIRAPGKSAPRTAAWLSAMFALVATGTALPATRTATFTVNANLVSDCTIVSAPTLDFGTIGVQNVAYAANSTLTVECTPGTAYTVGLDAGSVSGSSVATRYLDGPGGKMSFSLYRDASFTQVWGVTPGTDTAGGTGTGSNQSYTIYGRIFGMQTTRAPGTYTSTITATITY